MVPSSTQSVTPTDMLTPSSTKSITNENISSLTTNISSSSSDGMIFSSAPILMSTLSIVFADNSISTGQSSTLITEEDKVPSSFYSPTETNTQSGQAIVQRITVSISITIVVLFLIIAITVGIICLQIKKKGNKEDGFNNPNYMSSLSTKLKLNYNIPSVGGKVPLEMYIYMKFSYLLHFRTVCNRSIAIIKKVSLVYDELEPITEPTTTALLYSQSGMLSPNKVNNLAS